MNIFESDHFAERMVLLTPALETSFVIWCALHIKLGDGDGRTAAVGIPELFESERMDVHHLVIQ